MTGLLYLLVLGVSISGMVTIDHRWRLVFFRNAAAAVVALSLCVSLLLVWDVLGIRTGVFFRGGGDWMTGLVIAPELPIEEVVFLSFLSYLTLVLATASANVAQWRARRSGGAQAPGRSEADR